jgi:hypothetical protein
MMIKLDIKDVDCTATVIQYYEVTYHANIRLQTKLIAPDSAGLFRTSQCIVGNVMTGWANIAFNPQENFGYLYAAIYTEVRSDSK